MTRFDEIPDEQEVRRWATEYLDYYEAKLPQDRRLAARMARAEIAYFGPEVGVAIAGRDHAIRTPEGALAEAAELIAAATLLRDYEERVRTRAYAEARQEILDLEARLEGATEVIGNLVAGVEDYVANRVPPGRLVPGLKEARRVLGREILGEVEDRG